MHFGPLYLDNWQVEDPIKQKGAPRLGFRVSFRGSINLHVVAESWCELGGRWTTIRRGESIDGVGLQIERRRGGAREGTALLVSGRYCFHFLTVSFLSLLCFLFFGVRLLLFSLHFSPYRKIYPFYSFIWIHGEKLGS